MVNDFSTTELNIIKKAIAGRWKDINIHLADIDVAIASNDKKSTLCPAVVWETADCTFVIIKTAEFSYKNLFYYLGSQRFDTGIAQYNDLNECVLSLMKAQANFLLSKRK